MALIQSILLLPEERSFASPVFQAKKYGLWPRLLLSLVFGFFFAAMIMIFGAYLVNLDPNQIGFSLSDFLGLRFLLLALVLSVAMAVLAQSRLRPNISNRVRVDFVGVSAVLAIAIVLSAAWLYKSSAAQWYFLEAVKVRGEPFSLQRSMAYWKSEMLTVDSNAEKQSLSLVGSSQMNMAVSETGLSLSMPGFQVWKNTLPGFGILQYLMLIPSLEDQNSRLVICLLSEFDIFRDRRLPTERMRYFGEWPQKLELMSLMPVSLIWSNRSELADLMMADVTPFWRDRDLFRLLIQSAWWKAPPRAETNIDTNKNPEEITEHAQVLKQTIGRHDLVNLNFAAFEKFAELLKERGIELWVFEGMTNPLSTAVYDPHARLHTETRERFLAMAGKAGFTYIPSSEMPSFVAEDFADAVHLNTLASKRFTSFLADKICDSKCRLDSAGQ